jgi:hypothetical protein
MAVSGSYMSKNRWAGSFAQGYLWFFTTAPMASYWVGSYRMSKSASTSGRVDPSERGQRLLRPAQVQADLVLGEVPTEQPTVGTLVENHL